MKTKKVVLKNEIKKEPASFLRETARELLAITFWVYALVKLFAFDIDIYLINKFLPEYAWILNFKFPIIIVTVAIIWLITKNKHIVSWVLYILFYPFIIFVWKIPYFIFRQKSWVLAFAFINSIISFFKSIKHNFIAFAFFIASSVIIISFSNIKLLWCSAFIIFAILAITYIHKLILTFKPSNIFQFYTKIFKGLKKHGSASLKLGKKIKSLRVADLNSKQMEKRTTNLQTSVLFNRICLFTAKKLRDYQNSGFNIIYYIVTILALLILTVFSFAVINYALFKINSDFFSSSMSDTNFFTFFYYSFNNFLFNSIPEIVPTHAISQSAFMLESLFTIFLTLIFVSLLLSFRNQKHIKELSTVIKEIKKEGEDMEVFIKEEYKIKNIKDAMAELEKLQAGLVKLIYKITEAI